jgi:putative Holliday junction resolvase
MGRWIGIDYGGARTGLAYTDAAALLAFPHKTVPTDALPDELDLLIRSEPCAGIALGIPNAWGLQVGKGLTDSSAAILAFKASLEKRYPHLEIALVDETNTSEEALHASIRAGMKKSKRSRKGAVDDVAATLILQRFLEARSR